MEVLRTPDDRFVDLPGYDFAANYVDDLPDYEGLRVHYLYQGAKGANQTSKFAFPRYNRHSTTKANSASAALNKWLKQYVPIGCMMHSFRHSMRDRLRSVQCPSDIADQIGGWTSEGVGQGYGSGYPLNVLQEWME